MCGLPARGYQRRFQGLRQPFCLHFATMPSTPSLPSRPSADKAVIDLVSADRLGPYLAECGGEAEAALALYRWNSDLTAAFF